ncbi:DsbA family protein [Leucobacter albus]|uniref:DsbA family protein n=1 Tax=Leucobacter albus TaxID=272210 RepID=A0ABW3TLZ9_9MICO
MSQTTAQRIRSWIVPIGIIAIAGLLITLVVLQVRGGSAPSGGAEPPEGPDLSFVETRDPADVQAAGPVDAPVALVVYSDYQCPFCAKWSNDTLPTMLEYADRGDLRIEWRDVNQYGADSERGARAAHAAGMQGKFWEFHDALFPGGEHLSPEQLSEESLVALAGELGLDAEAFRTDLTSPATLQLVQRYAAAGQQLGVSGTPTFVLGGEPIVGAQPESVFVETFERALANAG